MQSFLKGTCYDAFTVRIVNSTSLKSLAKNPLLCAMLCALNYVYNEHLPENKMGLYEKCCEMLIDARDAQRKVLVGDTNNEIPKLEYSKKRRILEEVASWMLKRGDSSVKKDEVIEYIQSVLDYTNILDRNAKDIKAENILSYLVERSGIIREPEVGEIDFIHKTFMEFLAVKSICRNCEWYLLVKEACNPIWRETILMCIKEMGEKQVQKTLKDLMEKGNNEKNEKYFLMAAVCAANSMYSDLKIKNEIDLQIKKMIPPKKENIYELAEAEGYVLPFLFDKEEYTDSEREQCIALLSFMELEEAIPNILSFVQGTGGQDVKEFALYVLSDYNEAVLDEYNVKEQLAKYLLETINGKILIVQGRLLNLINGYEFDKYEKRKFDQVKKIHLYYEEEEDDYYSGCWNVLGEFKYISELIIEGFFKDILFVNLLGDLRVLEIISNGDLSEVIKDFNRIYVARHIKKIILKAECLNYLCQNDFAFMKELECLELYCRDDDLELVFEDLSCFPKLKKFIICVDSDLSMEISEMIPIWESQLPGLIIENNSIN